jgi:hypothetical protein
MSTADRMRNLILENAVRNGVEPESAVREFADVLIQLGEARHTAEHTHQQMVELGPQFAAYADDPGPEPYAGTLLSERDLKRSWAILKTRLRATNRSISILTNAANGLLGATCFRQGRLIDPMDAAPTVGEIARISRRVGQLEILETPGDGLIILEQVS